MVNWLLDKLSALGCAALSCALQLFFFVHHLVENTNYWNIEVAITHQLFTLEEQVTGVRSPYFSPQNAPVNMFSIMWMHVILKTTCQVATIVLNS